MHVEILRTQILLQKYFVARDAALLTAIQIS